MIRYPRFIIFALLIASLLIPTFATQAQNSTGNTYFAPNLAQQSGAHARSFFQTKRCTVMIWKITDDPVETIWGNTVWDIKWRPIFGAYSATKVSVSQGFKTWINWKYNGLWTYVRIYIKGKDGIAPTTSVDCP